MSDDKVRSLFDLKHKYDKALQSGDIELIISAGTAYLTEFRGGEMTTKDRDNLQKLALRIGDGQGFSDE